MGLIKDRNGMDLAEAWSSGYSDIKKIWQDIKILISTLLDIKKRWQEYTELYKKDLHDPENHNGVITDLEPDSGMGSQVGLRKHHYEQR